MKSNTTLDPALAELLSAARGKIFKPLGHSGQKESM
jgi:hypothetical protein